MAARERSILSVSSTVALAAIGLSLIIAASSAFAEVTVTQPWVRGTVPPQKATGAFMTLRSTTNAKLVAASSPTAIEVEIHEMAMINNVMRMRPVAGVALPAGKDVELRPGGYHIMLMGIKHQLKQGEVIPITLTVQESDGKTHTIEVKAPVRDLTAPPPSQAMPHDRH